MKEEIQKSKKKKVLHVFLLFVQILLFVILTLTIFTFISSKSAVFGSIRSMVVLTGSMEPKLPVGTVIYVQKQLGYDKGDIITFQDKGDNNVTHRIVDINFTEDGTVYTTKGDANNTNDRTPVQSTSIVGKTFISIPYVGKIINFLNTPIGFLVFIITPTFIVIGFELWNIKKEIEKAAEEKILAKLGGFPHPHTSIGTNVFTGRENIHYFKLHGKSLR